MQFDQKIIDISIIPDSSPSELTSTRIVLVQGYILKKMLKEYLSQLNKEEKLQFETTVVLLKLSKFLNNLDGIPGYLLELVTLFCIISDKPRSILAVFFAINKTLEDESTKFLCFSFSGVCDTCHNRPTTNQRFLKNVCIGGVIHVLDIFPLFQVVKEKTRFQGMTKVENKEGSLERLIKVLPCVLGSKRIGITSIVISLEREGCVEVPRSLVEMAMAKGNLGYREGTKTGYWVLNGEDDGNVEDTDK